MTVVAYGVDHGVDGLLNVVKGNGKPPTPPAPFAKISPNGVAYCYHKAFLRITISVMTVFKHYGRYSLMPLLFGKASQSKEGRRHSLGQLAN
jgi:hypothetical protein